MKIYRKMAKILICISIVSSFSLAAFNNAFVEAALQSDVYYLVNASQSVNAVSSFSGSLNSNKYTSNFSAAMTANFYNQLDSGQKTVYNALKTLTPLSSQMSIMLDEPITYTSAKPTPTYSEKVGAATTIVTMVQASMDALIKDYPEIFWLKFGSGGCSYDWRTTTTSSGSMYRQTISEILFTPVVADPYVSIASSIVSTLNAKVASFPIGGSTNYEKLKSIHDSLAALITYDLSAVRAYDAYGALIDGRSVCEGYSEAFKLLCDRENIPCILVVGQGVTSGGAGPHMWNAVQMEDGKWYGVDVTWDDQSTIRTDFFLVGSFTVDSAFGGMKFSQSHVCSGDFSGTGAKIFTYPPLSDTAYIPGGVVVATTSTTTEGQGTEGDTTTTTEAVIIPQIIPQTTIASIGAPMEITIPTTVATQAIVKTSAIVVEETSTVITSNSTTSTETSTITQNIDITMTSLLDANAATEMKSGQHDIVVISVVIGLTLVFVAGSVILFSKAK